MTTKHFNEEKIFIDFTQGDQRAFAAIYKAHYKPLFLFANKFLESIADAEDLVGDAFIKLWDCRAKFDNYDHIKGYLYVMTRNACLDLLRRRTLKSKIEEDLLAAQKEIDYEESFARMEIKSEVYTYVSSELKKLSPKYRKVFHLSFVEGLKNEEVADKLRLSNQVVRNIKTHIRKVFKVKSLTNNLLLMILFWFK